MNPRSGTCALCDRFSVRMVGLQFSSFEKDSCWHFEACFSGRSASRQRRTDAVICLQCATRFFFLNLNERGDSCQRN